MADSRFGASIHGIRAVARIKAVPCNSPRGHGQQPAGLHGIRAVAALGSNTPAIDTIPAGSAALPIHGIRAVAALKPLPLTRFGDRKEATMSPRHSCRGRIKAGVRA